MHFVRFQRVGLVFGATLASSAAFFASAEAATFAAFKAVFAAALEA